MAGQSSGDGRVVSDTPVNRSVLLSQTELIRLTQFCHALFYIGCINTNTLSLGFFLRVGFTRLWSRLAT